jgi:hypothetical protein
LRNGRVEDVRREIVDIGSGQRQIVAQVERDHFRIRARAIQRHIDRAGVSGGMLNVVQVDAGAMAARIAAGSRNGGIGLVV